MNMADDNSAYLNAAGQAAIAAGNYGAAQIASKKSFNYNKDLQRSQYDLNMQAWNATNEYNSPASQMARFKTAGLNPNLVYGQGNSGNAGPAPQYESPKWEGSRYPDIAKYSLSAQNMMTLAMQKKQMALLDLQAEGVDSDNNLKDLTWAKNWAELYGMDRNSAMKGSPYATSVDARFARFQKNLLDNALGNQNLRQQEMKTNLMRYTSDPTWYYGEKAIDKALRFVPRINLNNYRK